jgi:hypothetical protein
MPRYFFHTRIGDDRATDHDGVELAGPDEAWRVARATIRELLAEQGETRHLLSALLEVTTSDGEIVLEFPFSEALLDPDPPAPRRMH